MFKPDPNPNTAKRRKASSATDDENGVIIDQDMYARCLLVSRKCPEIRSCIEYIKRNILCKGIEMNHSKTNAMPEFTAHINEYYTRFCMDVIEVSAMFGVVPYILVNPRKSGSGARYGYPLVLKPEMGVIRVRYDDSGQIKYTYQPMNSEAPSHRVFFEVFNDVGKYGDINSIVSTLVPMYTFLQTQEINTFMANEMNTRPPMFLATSSDNSFSEKDIVQKDSYGAGIVAEQEFHAQMLRNRISLNVVNAQKAYLNFMNADANGGTGPEDFFGARRDRLTGFPVVDYGVGTSYTPEYVPLPNDVRPVNGNLPTPPPNLDGHRLHFQTIVCTSFALPISVVTGQMRNVNEGSASMLDSSLSNTFHFYKTKLSNLCLKCYRVIHEDHSYDVRIMFPSLVNNQAYSDLYNQGILTYDAYKTSLMKMLDLPASAFEKKPREIELELSNGANASERRDTHVKGSLS